MCHRLDSTVKFLSHLKNNIILYLLGFQFVLLKGWKVGKENPTKCLFKIAEPALKNLTICLCQSRSLQRWQNAARISCNKCAQETQTTDSHSKLCSFTTTTSIFNNHFPDEPGLAGSPSFPLLFVPGRNSGIHGTGYCRTDTLPAIQTTVTKH